MVAVAADHASRAGVEVVGARAHQPVLVDHEHAQAVAGVEQLGRRRVVRGAIGVAAHLLEAARCETPAARRASPTPTPAWSWWLLVPLSLTCLPLRKKPAFGSKRIVRMPNGRRRAIDDAPAGVRQRRHERVEVGVLERPERGSGSDSVSSISLEPPGASDELRSRGARRRTSPPVDERLQRVGRSPARARRCATCRATGTSRRPLVDLRAHPRAVGGDVQGRGLRQPDVAVDARALVVPALLQRGVDAHRDDVVAAVVEVVADVVARAEVAARLVADEEAVHEDARVAVDAVELDRRSAARGRPRARRTSGDTSPRSVPGNRGPTALKPWLGLALGSNGASTAQSWGRFEPAPAAVVEGRARGSVAEAGLGEVGEVAGGVAEVPRPVGGVAEGEPPAVVETQALTPGDGRLRCRCGGARERQATEREEYGVVLHQL